MWKSPFPRLAPVLLVALTWAGCSAVHWVTPTGEGRAAIDAPPPKAAPSVQPQVAGLHEARRWSCEPAASTGDNFCELKGITPLGEGRALVFGAFRGRVRIGTHELRSRGMENALVMMLEPDGSVAWVRQYGEQWHNSIHRVVRLSDGRFAASGIAANGFHSGLSARPTKPGLGFNTERPFVGVLNDQGEWAWVRDWPDFVLDLRLESERLVVLDASRWTRLGGDGAVLASRALASLPDGAMLIPSGARLGSDDCAWLLFGAYARQAFSLVVRSTCADATTDWPLAELASPQSPLQVATSPGGQSLYLVASETPAPQAEASRRGQIRQTLWRVDARQGLRFAVGSWPAEDGALLPEQRSQPLALAASDGAVDLLVSYQSATPIAGMELPAAMLPLNNGVPRSAVILRFATSDGSLLEAFTPPGTLGRDLALGLLSDRPVFAPAPITGGSRWFDGTATASDGGLEGNPSSVLEVTGRGDGSQAGGATLP